ISTAMESCPHPPTYEKFLCVQPFMFEHNCTIYFGMPEDNKAILQRLWQESPFRLSDKAKDAAARLFRPDRTAITFTLSEVEKRKFEKALAFLHKLGFTENVEWNFVDPKDDEAFGF